MHHYRQALLRMRQGDSDREIAAAKIMGRRKASDWRAAALAQGWLDPAAVLPDDETIVAVLDPPKRAASTVSSLEDHRPLIALWVEQGVSGTAIHQALQRAHGWTGSYSAVRRHPDGQTRRTWAFVMTLCHSRHQYVEFVWDQTVATWLGCHRRAFEWFAGVPQRIVIDNAKCAITKACAHDPHVQRTYAECAEGYGFRIDPCPPHDPQKKGIVESGVKYVKGNFLPLREFRDLADLNAQARAWVMNEAGQRRHGTTRVAPLELFTLERTHLQALPEQAPDLGSWSRVCVHRDCHVKFDHCLYSAPFSLVGKTLWLRATDGAVSLYHEHRLVASHARSLRPGQRMTVRDHLPPKAQLFFAHDRHWLAQQAQSIGPACTELLQRLLGDRIVERLRAAQGVIHLAKPYGPMRLEAACARALAAAFLLDHYRLPPDHPEVAWLGA